MAENTVAAFDRALEQGCDGFEFDVRLTGCGAAVVSHPARVAGVTVARASRTQLSKLPGLEDVIKSYGSRGFLDIELKVEGLERSVLSALREHPPERSYVVSSFLPAVLLELKARSAVVPVGVICSRASQLVAWRKLPVEYVIVRAALVTRRLVDRIQAASRKILVWTVNDPISMQRFAGWGVDGIISDKAKLLVQTLRPLGRSAAKV